MKAMRLLPAIVMLAALVLTGGGHAFANGTETLGPLQGVTLAGGTGILAAGVGLATAEGDKIITFSLPASATVEQVFFYWEGQTPFGGDVDVTFQINGVDIAATDPGDASDSPDRIGAPISFYVHPTAGELFAIAYRLDISALNLVAAGLNQLTISNLDAFGFVTEGAGVIVIYQEPSLPAATIDARDGIDLAFIDFEGDKQVTAPQTFDFPAAPTVRQATLSMLFSSAKGPASGGGEFRPSSIEVTTGGIVTKYSDLLSSSDGPEWDSRNLLVEIPAGASSLTVQAFSRDDNNTDALPASFFWIAAGLSIPPAPPGGDQGCTPGYWKQPHHFGNWPHPYAPTTQFSEVFEDAFPGMTLLEVLRQGGGGIKSLGRHIVASLLNAQADNVHYELAPGDVIARFNDVFPGEKRDYNALKDMVEHFNESYCPLGRALLADPLPSYADHELDGGGEQVALLQNFPNPFNPETQIVFAVPDQRYVTLRIYSMLGAEVRTLVNGTVQAGFHQLVWDGKDSNGNPVVSGIYVYRLAAGDIVQTMRMSLVR